MNPTILLSVLFSVLALAGCADNPPIQPVTITGSDMCRILKKDDFTWDISDTPQSITVWRRTHAKWYSRCGKKAKGAPTP